VPKSLRVDGGSIFVRVKADINAKELAWWALGKLYEIGQVASVSVRSQMAVRYCPW